MDPLTPNDPLWKLLGQGREVKVRTNFTQDVLREARQTPQDKGLRGKLRAWWAETIAPLPTGGLVLAATALVTVGFFSVQMLKPAPVSGPQVAQVSAPTESVPAVVAGSEPSSQVVKTRVIETPLVPEVETQLESLDQIDALLALEDTSSFSDQEIAFLLY